MSVNVTASSSTITATATGTAVEAGVSSSTVSASSSGGIGPQGPQGPQGPPGEGVDVEWNDILNKPSTFPPDTTSLATVAVSGSYDDLLDQPTIPPEYTLPAANSTTLGGIIIGTGLSFFANGSVSVSYGTGSTNACRGDDSRLSNARTPTSHVHGNISNAGAIGSTSGQIVVTTTSGVLTTAASISTSQVSGLATVATSGSASDLGTGTLPAARLPTHTHAIADVTSLQTTLDGKAASSHGHAIADVTGLQTALDGKQASGSYAAASHTHAVGDLTQSGATTNQVIQWNGSAWAPATVSGGSSAWSSITGTPTTLAGYGITDAASSSHTHAASDITSGTIATARLASGTASATTYLRGDQTWATVSSGSATTNAADLTSGTLNDARLSFVPLHPFLLMGG